MAWTSRLGQPRVVAEIVSRRRHGLKLARGPRDLGWVERISWTCFKDSVIFWWLEQHSPGWTGRDWANRLVACLHLRCSFVFDGGKHVGAVCVVVIAGMQMPALP